MSARRPLWEEARKQLNFLSFPKWQRWLGNLAWNIRVWSCFARHKILSVESWFPLGVTINNNPTHVGPQTENSSHPRERLVWGPRHCPRLRQEPTLSKGQLLQGAVTCCSQICVLPGHQYHGSWLPPSPCSPQATPAHHNPISTLTVGSQQLSLGHHIAPSVSSIFLPAACLGAGSCRCPEGVCVCVCLIGPCAGIIFQAGRS